MLEPQEEFIDYDPERLKEGLASRVALFTKRREDRTPLETSLYNINKALETYFPAFNEEERQDIQNQYSQMTVIKTMNPKAFAATVAFITNNPIDRLSADKFKDENILQYINPVLSTKIKEDDLQKIRTRYKAQILRYIRAILNYRKEYEL